MRILILQKVLVLIFPSSNIRKLSTIRRIIRSKGIGILILLIKMLFYWRFSFHLVIRIGIVIQNVIIIRVIRAGVIGGYYASLS